MVIITHEEIILLAAKQPEQADFLSAANKSLHVGQCAVNSDKSATRSWLGRYTIWRYLYLISKRLGRPCRLVRGGSEQDFRYYVRNAKTVLRVSHVRAGANER